MYNPIEGGSSKILMEDDPELALEVFLPPVGKVWNYHTNQLEDTEIICRSSIKSEQYWERPPQPKDYAKKARKEKAYQRTDPEYYDPELAEYRNREWHRRLYGAWFMNRGKPVYLTGLYYFYLAHWTIDIGAPHFRMADVDKSYFWDYCVEDPRCYGMIEMTKRRAGKTYWGTCAVNEFISRTPYAHGGIQSKTGPDAKLVFSEKLIQPWRKLVDFFRPKYDQSKGNIPKSELRYSSTSKKGAGADEIYEEEEELASWIDFMNSGTHAYDGQKLLRYLCDEVFKTIEADIVKRHAVIKPCLEDTSGNIIGKAIYTSTVEEMEGHLEKYVKLWEDSDINKRDDNGRTKSGLYRFFTPAQKLMHVDKYGFADEEKALAQIENTIKSFEDARDISDYIRKNPRNWKEAFRTGSDNCLFNPVKIDDQMSVLQFLKEDTLYKRYNLIWDEKVDDGAVPRIKLVETKNGRYCLANDFVEKFANSTAANDVHRRGSQFIPKNNLRFIIGVDPFDHNRTRNGKFSQGAAAIFMKYDPLDPELSDNFVGYYLGRPASSGIFYDDMVKLCHWLSCQMLYEDNKPKIGDHFIDNGYGAFLMRDEKGHPGIPASPKTHQILFEHLESHIEANCHRTKFLRMLKDWKELDPDFTTDYDLGMASGYALIGANRIVRRESTLKKVNQAGQATLLRKYKIKSRYGATGKFARQKR